MNGAGSSDQILHADPEHGGIRFAVLLALVFTYLAGFALLQLLLRWLASGTILFDFATTISCVGAVPLALGCSWLVERYLKSYWTSGLAIELDENCLRFTGAKIGDETTGTIELDLNKRINLTHWYFRLAGYPKAGRERLVSDKWICLASQMQQDDKRIVTFTFAPPGQAEALIDNQELVELFHQISLVQLYRDTGRRLWNAASRPEISADLLAGPDGRYWIAERRRWEEGVELTAEDFSTLIDQVAGKVAFAYNDID